MCKINQNAQLGWRINRVLMITSKKNKKKKKKGPPQIQKDPILLYGPDDPMFPKWTYNAKYHYPEHCRWRHPEPYTVKCPECDELAALRTEAENSKSQIRQNLWADHSEAWRTFKDGGYYGFDGVNKGYSPDQVIKRQTRVCKHLRSIQRKIQGQMQRSRQSFPPEI